MLGLEQQIININKNTINTVMRMYKQGILTETDMQKYINQSQAVINKYSHQENT